MPEGDTVYLAAKRMAAAPSGQRLPGGNCAIRGSPNMICRGGPCLAYTASTSTFSPVSMMDEACTRISGWMAPGTFTNPGSGGDDQTTKPVLC
jgi:hypothetical protein